MLLSLRPFFIFMDSEIWKDVPGFGGQYKGSTHGRIRSIFFKTKLGNIRVTGTILKPSINSSGYFTLRLNRKTYKVHRLICAAFHENKDNRPQVNHKDLNPLNNFSENLEWCTAKENTNHAQVNGRRPIAQPRIKKGHKNRPKGYKKVVNTKTGEIYNTVLELSVELGVTLRAIRRKLAGERPNNTPYRYFTK